MTGSLEVLSEFMGSLATLGKVSGGPEKVHGFPKPRHFLSFATLWCDLHVLQVPRGVCIRCRICWKIQIWQSQRALGRFKNNNHPGDFRNTKERP